MPPRSSPDPITYENSPVPFVVPANQEIERFGPNLFIPRETLHYAGRIIEEIMRVITDEYNLRELTPPTWKLYKTSLTDFVVFTPHKNGRNLNGTPVKWFPQYITDAQNAIDGLLADSRIPDTRAALLARIFANNMGVPQLPYNSQTKLKDSVQINVNGELKTINPLSRAQAGLWPFVSDDVINVTPKLGVTPDKIIQGDLNVVATDFPQSVIGATTPSGIDGIDVPMTSTTRPTLGSRTQQNPFFPSEIVPDKDHGYGYLGHLDKMAQQIRWQPPIVEWWPTDQTPRDYTTNLISRLTPNKEWVLSQPAERTTLSPQNWGYWLIKGHVGISDNRAHIRVRNNPSVQVGQLGQCPFSIFFPPPVVNCSCGFGDSAYFIWWSSEYVGFNWNDVQLVQSTIRAKPKKFNKNTRLKIKISGFGNNGSNAILNEFRVGIRTKRIGIIDAPFNDISITSLALGASTTIDVNIMEELNRILGWYKIEGTDALMALKLEVITQTSASWECETIDGPQNRIVPNDCLTRAICTNPDSTVLVDYVLLDEEGLSGRDPVLSYT